MDALSRGDGPSGGEGGMPCDATLDNHPSSSVRTLVKQRKLGCASAQMPVCSLSLKVLNQHSPPRKIL